MATLADVVLGNVSQQLRGPQESILDTQQKATQTGLQLATVEEQVQQQRLKVEQQKQQINTGKLNNQLKWIDRINRAKSPRERSILMGPANRAFETMDLPPISETTAEQWKSDPLFQSNMKLAAQAARRLAPNASQELVNEIAQTLASDLGAAENVEIFLKSTRQQQAQRKEAIVAGREERKITQQEFKNVTTLRNEFQTDPVTENTKDIQQAFTKVKNASEKDTAAGDLALIFNFMKMLDPGSVVREGEFATAQNTAGVPDRVRNFYNRAIRGTRLSKTQRSQFAEQAGIVLEGQLQNQIAVNDRFTAIAKRNALDVRDLGIGKEFTLESLPERKPEERVAAQPVPAVTPPPPAPDRDQIVRDFIADGASPEQAERLANQVTGVQQTAAPE